LIKYVYVAGPLTKDPMAGARNALRAGTQLRDAGLGLIVMVPHLSIFWELLHPAPYETWMAQDFAWIEKCDALLRLPGESKGTGREVMFARERGIPVFVTVEELIWAVKTQQGVALHPVF
jgi:hypothetical protein